MNVIFKSIFTCILMRCQKYTEALSALPLWWDSRPWKTWKINTVFAEISLPLFGISPFMPVSFVCDYLHLFFFSVFTPSSLLPCFLSFYHHKKSIKCDFLFFSKKLVTCRKIHTNIISIIPPHCLIKIIFKIKLFFESWVFEQEPQDFKTPFQRPAPCGTPLCRPAVLIRPVPDVSC